MIEREYDDDVIASRACLNDVDGDKSIKNNNLRLILEYYENETYRYVGVDIDKLSLVELKELKSNISNNAKIH